MIELKTHSYCKNCQFFNAKQYNFSDGRIEICCSNEPLCSNATDSIAKEILDKIGIAFKKIEPSYVDEYFETVFEDFTTEFNKIYDEYVNS